MLWWKRSRLRVKRALLTGRGIDGGFGVEGLIELDVEVAGGDDLGDQAVALVGDGGGELDAFGLEVSDGFVDVVAEEGDGVGVVFGVGIIGIFGVDAHVGAGEVEDEPAAAGIGEGEAEFVAEEGTEFFGFGGVEHGVDACDHGVNI